MTRVIPVRQDLRVLPADDPTKRKIGFVIKEQIGTAVYNPAVFIPQGCVVVKDEEFVCETTGGWLDFEGAPSP